ncbi:hypothetical protein V6N13_126940 [Hibiscus sabdariffa]
MGSGVKANPHRPWNSQENQGVFCGWCHQKRSFMSFKRSVLIKQDLQGMAVPVRKQIGWVSNGHGQVKKMNGHGHDPAEEDMRLVEALREAQSYVFLHRGNTFVLLLSADIVASPYLDSILKLDLLHRETQIYMVSEPLRASF